MITRKYTFRCRHRDLLRSLSALALFGVLSLLGSTSHGQDSAATVNVRVSPHATRLFPQRVVLVTTLNRLDRLQEQDQFAIAVANALRSCAGMQVSIAKPKLCTKDMPHHSGTFDELLLIEKHKKLRADAVLYCEVLEFDPYEPSNMTGHLVLVSTREAVSLLEVDFHLNLGCGWIDIAFEKFLKSSEESPRSESRSSPTTFLKFCAQLTVSHVLKSIRASPAVPQR